MLNHSRITVLFITTVVIALLVSYMHRYFVIDRLIEQGKESAYDKTFLDPQKQTNILKAVFSHEEKFYTGSYK